MNILYLHQYFATPASSTSIRSYVFAKKLVDSGHKVTVITTDAFLENEQPYQISGHVKHYQFDGIEVRAVSSSYSNYMNKYQRIREFVKFSYMAQKIGKKQKNADLIFATSTPLTIGIPAMQLKRKLKIPYIFEVRDLWPEAPIQLGYLSSKPAITLARWLEKKIYQHAEHIIALSPGMAKGVIATSQKADKVSVIPNLADLNLFQDDNVDEHLRHRLIRQLDLEGKFVLTHIGAMGEANGLEHLVEAALHLKRKNIMNVKILIVGNGKTKPRLSAFCEQHALENVQFLDTIKKEEVPTYTSLANVTMTSFLPKPILATNSPNKFFDSLAAGKPIIVNSSGWTRKIVESEGIGYYADPKKPKDLASLLMVLSKHKNELAHMKPKIRSVATKKFSAEKLANDVLAIVSSIDKERSIKK
ncbi:glycosyltransferase family 4 protein [Listeria aquatica]|uniref:Glycosyltransferase family 4 protein n=1 Tax=Listeria aquatica TaxID=1494960 RepID=A0A841ZMQ0_9LIST|nr:glycosyltransferase family 4 protein [Listeria aquatica]MBC1520280.1 glycosyltransferase family 4 protein [Listeria aquatica]